MTATNQPESTALAVADRQFDVAAPMDAASLILGPAFDRVQAFAALMCKGTVTVPQHLRGNPGDCMAVTLAALSRRMDPFAFAQKTHITKSGAIGYEAQLIKSMITTSGAVTGQPEYEFLGDWTRVLGKVEERQSEKSGGKYYVATYKKSDEEGLGVTIRWTLRGESKPREMTVMMSQCYPRFSTQWATDPQQQICYVADRKFARRYCPETILGVYDIDELGEPAEPKFMGPADVVGSPPPPPAPKEWPADLFAERLPEWLKAIKDKKATADGIVAKARTKYPLSAAQEKAIRMEAKTEATDVAPKVSFAQVADGITKAANLDALAEAATLIAAVMDDEQRAELQAKYTARETELKAQG